MDKNGKYVRLWILIAQKKRPVALNATQKTSALCKVLFLRKNLKKLLFLDKIAKNGIFKGFFMILSKTVY